MTSDYESLDIKRPVREIGGECCAARHGPCAVEGVSDNREKCGAFLGRTLFNTKAFLMGLIALCQKVNALPDRPCWSTEKLW